MYLFMYPIVSYVVSFETAIQSTMYPMWMKILLFYFDLWGFCTRFKSSSKIRRVTERIIFIFHLISVTTATLIILNFLRRPIGDKLGTVNDSMKLGAILLVYWWTILELNLKRKIQQRFWDIFFNIDTNFCCSCRLNFKSYVSKIPIFLTIFLLLYVRYFIRLFTLNKSGLYFFWFCYTFTNLFCKNQFFYYLFFLEFIKNELEMVDFEISEILCACKNGEMKRAKYFVKKFHRNRLKWVRQFYGSIYDLCDVLNSVFGWSNVSAILISFLLILADFNWLFKTGG